MSKALYRKYRSRSFDEVVELYRQLRFMRQTWRFFSSRRRQNESADLAALFPRGYNE